VTPAQIAEALTASGQAYEAMLRSSPAGVATWHPKKGEWCINECAGHVIEGEKHAFAGRIRRILADDEPEFERWDPEAIAGRRNDCARQPSALADELSALRMDSVELVRTLTTDRLSRGGTHWRIGRLTINELLHEWVHHDAEHLRQALANIQGYVWAGMANAQRFMSG
jgi:hypothetical protein